MSDEITAPFLRTLEEKMDRRFDRIDGQQAQIRADLEAFRTEANARFDKVDARLLKIETVQKITASDIQGMRADLEMQGSRMEALEAATKSSV